jgi:hypothetical protein
VEHGDAFKINLSPSNTSDGTVANPTESNFNITAELKWNNRSEEVEIPIDVVDTSAPSTDEDEDDADAEDGPVLTPSINGEQTWELDLAAGESATVQVSIYAPTTIQELNVAIESESEDFMELIDELNLREFDLCNIQDETTESSVKNYLKMPYNEEVKGQTNFTFDVSGFMEILSNIPLTHRFILTVKDGEGNVSSGTLVVNCESEEEE